MPLLPMPDRLYVYHTATDGDSPEDWQSEVAGSLRGRVTALSNDAALAADATGRYRGMATHQGRVEYHEALVVGALVVRAADDKQFLVLGVREGSRRRLSGQPQTVMLTLQVLSPQVTI